MESGPLGGGDIGLSARDDIVSATRDDIVLSAQRVSKSFNGVQVLFSVDFICGAVRLTR